MIQLTDVFQIQPDSELVKLKKSEKHRLMDEALNLQDADRRGLRVQFSLSHSGRRINNRIYTPKGQRDSVSTWTEPYPKPILLHHDEKQDPIGRFTRVVWRPIDQQAIQFFDHITDYAGIKRALESDDPRTIYKALKRNKLLLDERWPGVGVLDAEARIHDENAIEKFLDGRYLTFSASATTDRYVCGICESDWAQGDFCEHSPGKVVDGEVGTFITGKFIGREGSIVNKPADALSQVKSLRFDDSVQPTIPEGDKWDMLDESTIYIVDSSCSFSDRELQIHLQDPRQLVKDAFDSNNFDLLADAIEGSTHLEVTWLVKIHDALHLEYDWRVRHYTETSEGEEVQTPLDVFKLHATIHDLSEEKGFRGALLNGPLDNFSADGSKTGQYLIAKSASEDSEEGVIMQDVETIAKAIAEAVSNRLQKEIEDDKTSPADKAEEVKEEKEVQDEKVDSGCIPCRAAAKKLIDGVDWALLDLALQGELASNDAVLSTAARKKLPDSAFCGPNRTYPAHDRAHAINALARVKQFGSPALQRRVKRCVCRKFPSLPACKESDSVGEEEDLNEWTDELIAEALRVDKIPLPSKLTQEKRDSLPDDVFIGPGRLFPVFDRESLAAARAVIESAQTLTDAQKEVINRLIDEKAELISTSNVFDDIYRDYAEALKRVDELRNELQFKDKILNDLVRRVTEVFGIDLKDERIEDQLDNIVEWFDNMSKSKDDTHFDALKHAGEVENPSGNSSYNTQGSGLGDYERQVIERYKNIRDERGLLEAEAYLAHLKARGYVKYNFDVCKFLKE